MINTAWFETTSHFLEKTTMASAYHGLVHLHGLSPRFFDMSSVLNFKDLDFKENIIVGSIPAIRMALRAAGRAEPNYIDYPIPLRKFLKRNISLITKQDFEKDWEAYRNFFIKPYQHKMFNGRTFRSMPDLLALGQLHANSMIWVSEQIDIKSEWRIYVLNKEVINISHYSGDPQFMPDIKTVYEMVNLWNNSPIAYSLDVGINKETILIEANDAFALGQYSFIPSIQAKMLLARWEEMIQ